MDSTADHDEIGPSEDASISSRISRDGSNGSNGSNGSSKDSDESTNVDKDESASASMLAETIARAAASAVAQAAFNQRSDSILSPECSEYGEDDDGSSRNLAEFESQSRVPAMSEDAYMESESIEATVTACDQRTKLLSRGKSINAADIRSSVLSDGSFGESAREWERSPFTTVPEPVPATDDEPEQNAEVPSAVETIPDTVEAILQACGALTLSVECLRTLWEQSEVAIIRTLYLSRSGNDFQMPDQFSNAIRISSTVPDDNAFLLHSVFATFCTPCPSMESVEKILEMEHSGPSAKEAVALPMDALISMPSPHKEAVVKILRSHRHLLHLPPAFHRAFFRILIRLLTNRTDAEYDRDCTLNMKWERDDDVESRDSTIATSSASRQESHLPGVSESDAKLNDLQKATHDRIQKVRESREAIDRRRKEQLWCVERMPQPSGKQATSKRLDQVYAFVRFRAGGVWEGKPAVSVLLDLLDAVQGNHQYLLPPVITLIGLVSTAGVAVCEVLRMLQAAGQPVKSKDFLDRVLLVKALTAAAEGDSQSSSLVGKASPKYFFTFGKSADGMSRKITSLPHWPFRNDFGAAVWFRCETFDQNVNPTLVSIASPQGAGIDVSLMPLENDQAAAVIVVTVRDADSEEVERVIVSNCVLLPRVWYHLGVRHTRSRLKGVFSLSARQQLSIFLDGKLMQTESLRFPNITGAENALSPPKSFLSGLQIGKTNTTSLTVQFGAQFEGQTGALYLFSDCLSDATLKALCHITAGTRQKLVKKSLLNDDNWDSKNQPGKAVVELNSVDADEVVMAQEKIPRLQRWTSSVIDLSDADDSENDVLPELSRTALHSKLFLVWDPKRVEGSVAIDLHSGAHATMDSNVVQASCVDGIKDVIASVGGVQTLLPIANTLLSGEIERHWKHPNQEADRSTDYCFHASTSIVPSLLSMMAAFLRSHDKNAREMMRCGGIDILEQLLLQNKELGASGQSIVSVVRTTPSLTNLLVDSLLELRLACEHYAALENTVFSRLLFNMPLWFGGASLPVGMSLYPTLLPVLSSLTNVTPQKVRNTVGVRPLVELLHLYTDVGETKVRFLYNVKRLKRRRAHTFIGGTFGIHSRANNGAIR
ncbi:protein of unknown function (DUF4704) [Fragilaria crotonensis]|nr:protein of unknown function (DUF4704) [Fragilaria crotonensis]